MHYHIDIKRSYQSERDKEIEKIYYSLISNGPVLYVNCRSTDRESLGILDEIYAFLMHKGSDEAKNRGYMRDVFLSSKKLLIQPWIITKEEAASHLGFKNIKKALDVHNSEIVFVECYLSSSDWYISSLTETAKSESKTSSLKETAKSESKTMSIHKELNLEQVLLTLPRHIMYKQHPKWLRVSFEEDGDYIGYQDFQGYLEEVCEKRSLEETLAETAQRLRGKLVNLGLCVDLNTQQL